MRTILLVEDESEIAELLQCILEAEGYRVVMAANGAQGLECLARVGADLVLSDVLMPSMSGTQMATAIRAHPRFANVPIVLASALARDEVEREFADFDVLLQKPFGMRELLGMLDLLLADTAARPARFPVPMSAPLHAAAARFLARPSGGGEAA